MSLSTVCREADLPVPTKEPPAVPLTGELGVNKQRRPQAGRRAERKTPKKNRWLP